MSVGRTARNSGFDRKLEMKKRHYDREISKLEKIQKETQKRVGMKMAKPYLRPYISLHIFTSSFVSLHSQR